MIISKLAAYAAEQSDGGLSPEVTHAAKRVLIDWFAALLPGTVVQPGTSLRQAYAKELGLGTSSLPGCGTTAFAGTAAWINGSTSHAVEFDDIFRDAIYHPGCPTIAAALALCEQENLSGQALLGAITVGYEISTRIGAAIQPAHYKYFHTTGTVGCFGAAAAGAVLMARGCANTAAHALATAATFASGLQQAFRSDAMTKALHAGHAAWVGVAAAQGAAHGVTGVLDILEGEVGFGAALCDSPDWGKATEELGDRYNIESITLKNHGCCGHTFAAIDALLALKSQHGFSDENIASIVVNTYKAAIDVAGILNPQSAFEAKFSLPYVMSHAAIYDSVRLSAFGDERLHNPRLRRLMEKITLIADIELTRVFPGVRAARVRVTLTNGESFEHFAPHRRGDPESPLSDDELGDKFRELAGPIVGVEKAAELLAALWHIDHLKSISELNLACR